MTLAKRKLSLSLDEDLVAELEAASTNLSAQVNAAVRTELDRRRRHRLLADLLDELDVQDGPLEESLIQKYVRLLA